VRSAAGRSRRTRASSGGRGGGRRGPASGRRSRRDVVMNAQKSIRRHLFISVIVIVLLVGGIGGWASTSEFAGAVIAQGTLVVDSNSKKVQHPTGGVVAELNVRDGDQVKLGDVVIKLDDTQTRANLQIVTKGIDELSAKRSREETELEGGKEIVFPKDLTDRQDDP